MKKLIISLVACLSLVSTPFLTGCKTTGGVTDVNQIQKVSSIVESVVYSAVLLDIANNKSHTNSFAAVGNLLGELANSTNLVTAEFITKVVETSNIQELRTVEAKICLNIALGVYNAYFSENVNLNISQNEWVKTLLTVTSRAILRGIEDGKNVPEKVKKATVSAPKP